MNKWILISLLTFIGLISYGQSKNQKKLEKLFLTQYCSCLGQDASLTPEVILYKKSSECIITFQKENTELINEIVKEDYPKNTSISEQERRNDSGRRMVQNTIIDLVRSCDFYRSTLNKYKANLIDQLGVTKENAHQGIKEMIDGEKKVKDNQSLALYFTLLGVMHEYINDKKSAIGYYDKALKAYELTATKGLRELLIAN
jgi:hypothetical protein